MRRHDIAVALGPALLEFSRKRHLWGDVIRTANAARQQKRECRCGVAEG
jgi:hypothetical protein